MRLQRYSKLNFNEIIFKPYMCICCCIFLRKKLIYSTPRLTKKKISLIEIFFIKEYEICSTMTFQKTKICLQTKNLGYSKSLQPDTYIMYVKLLDTKIHHYWTLFT